MKQEFPRSEAIRFGWETAKKNIRFYLIALPIVFAISFLFSSLDSSLAEDATMARFVVGITSWVVSSITSIGLIRISLNFVEKKQSAYTDLFTYYNRTVNYMATSILYGLIIVAGIILLVIPAIYWGIRFQFFSYLVTEKNLGPIESLKGSWQMTAGHTWQLFIFGLLMMGINLLGVLALFVGMFWAIPTTQVATAYIYKHLSKQN
jgi:uncharacterized membrane protein